MRKSNSFGAKMTDLELLNTNAKAHVTDMPFLQPILTDLDALITEAKSLDSEQEVARKQLADITHRRQDAESRGQKLRSRIAAHLKGNFGYTSDQLIQFGITPRPRVTRRKKQAPPAAHTSTAQ